MRRAATALRVACHAAAEIPFVVLCAVSMAQGWRPVFDNAGTAWRSWLVLTANSPLDGHRVSGTISVFAPGPLQYWLLAIPVRLDPGQGALWGSALAAVVGLVLAVEAAWSAGRGPAAAVVSASVLVVLLTQPGVGLDVVWNAWFAAVWLVVTLATAWATGTGGLRWWPVTVLAASIVAQCHELFVLPCLAVVVVSALLGVGVRWRRSRVRGIGRAWWVVGLAVGIACWVAPLVQEATGHPGNLTSLWRQAHRHVPAAGSGRALGLLGSLTRPLAAWWHGPPNTTALPVYQYVDALFGGARWWGVAVLVLLGLIAVVAGLTRRRRLCAAAALAGIAALTMTVEVAAWPTSQLLLFAYVVTILVPIGILAWLVLLCAAAEVVVAAARALRLVDVSSVRLRLARLHRTTAGVSVSAAAILLVVGGVAIGAGAGSVDTNLSTLVGWSAVHASTEAAVQAEHLAPRTPFVLVSVAPRRYTPAYDVSVATGTGYLLLADGLQPHLTGDAATEVGQPLRPPPGLPKLVIRTPRGGGRPTVTLRRSR